MRLLKLIEVNVEKEEEKKELSPDADLILSVYRRVRRYQYVKHPKMYIDIYTGSVYDTIHYGKLKILKVYDVTYHQPDTIRVVDIESLTIFKMDWRDLYNDIKKHP